jgi:L-ascorbate metabolism protein UlaG (beta-lactamase superfamily)
MGRLFRYAGLAAGLLALAVGITLIPRIDRCLLDDLVPIFNPTPPPFFVTFLGVTTLLIDDGADAILIDGSFTRPAVSSGSSTVVPDAGAGGKIDTELGAAQITTATASRTLRLVAVVVNHSHYDHALDAPEVANKTNATLVGSSTTATIGRGRSTPVPESRLRIFNTTGETRFCLGRFSLTAVRTGHLQFAGVPFGEIATPTNPTTVDGYVEGGTYALFIRRRARTMMVQGSAGFAAGALQNRRADVVYVAVGGLLPVGQASTNFWNETVTAVMPRRIFPIHWDPLDGDLTDTPTGIGTIGIDFARNQAGSIDFQVPQVRVKTEPFAGL